MKKLEGRKAELESIKKKLEVDLENTYNNGHLRKVKDKEEEIEKLKEEINRKTEKIEDICEQNCTSSVSAAIKM